MARAIENAGGEAIAFAASATGEGVAEGFGGEDGRMGHADRAQISQERIAPIIATAMVERPGELIGEAARRGRRIVFEGAPAGLLANEPVRRGRLEV